MAKPLMPSPEAHRNGTNGAFNIRAALAEASPASQDAAPNGRPHSDEADTSDALRAENDELRALCAELEQALQESSQQNGSAVWEERIREYDALLEEKNEVIRNLHQDLQAAQCAIADAEAAANEAPPKRAATGPLPREDELLALSEELEQERRQLQDDEQTLMDQMREMEVSMAKERAEMARQRHDLQRLQSDISHELDRLEKSGALQSKIDGLRNKLQDVSTRRGAAPGAAPQPKAPAKVHETVAKPLPAQKKESFIGRLFG